MPQETDRFLFGPFVFDVTAMALTRDGESVALTPLPSAILREVVLRRGDVVSKATLATNAWKQEHVDGRTIDFQIHVLRKALGSGPDGRPFLETVHGRGVRLAVPVVPAMSPVAPESEGSPAALVPEAASPPWDVRGVRAGVAIVGIVAMGMVVAAAAYIWSTLSPASLEVVTTTALTADRRAKRGEPLLTDGARILYTDGLGDALMSVPITGGVPSPVIPTPNHFRIIDIDPAASRFLAQRLAGGPGDEELWTLPAASGEPQRVGDLHADWAAWSPDYRHIAYVRHRRLHVARSDGSGSRVLPLVLPPDDYPTFPHWSPSGRSIRVTILTPQPQAAVRRAIWEIGVDGGGPKRIFDHADFPDVCCGSWSADGTLYVFQAIRDGRSDLWAHVEPRAGLWARRPSLYRLTFGPMNFESPLVSADGRRIYAIGWQPMGELARLSRAERTLIPYAGGPSATHVTFSPDGQWVAYNGYPDRQLWRARIDGTDRQQLTFGPFATDGAAWSPDGRWIAYRTRSSGPHMKIHLIPTSGGRSEPLAPDRTTPDRDQGLPSWSPDSNRLVFGDVPARFGVPEGHEVLHIYDRRAQTYSTIAGSGGLWTVRWSPDGRYLVALTIRDQELRVFDLASGAWRTLPVRNVNTPNWSSDSEWVYFDTEGLPRKLGRVRLRDGLVEDLADLRDYPIGPYWWSGLSPQDEPLLVRSLNPQEIYALELARDGR